MKEKIYLIPGLMTDERLWSKLTPYLDEKYELIHLPIPDSEDFDEINKILDEQIEDEEINLLGFSLGGYIASYYATTFPKKVKRLFLLSSTPSGTEQKDIPRRQKKLEEAREGNFISLDEKKAIDLLEVKDDEELVSIVCDMFNELGNETFTPQLALTLKREELFEKLNELDIPTYLFYSLDDRLLNHTSVKALEGVEHDFKINYRVGTSHNISLEVPRELSFHIENWMKI
ncbi:MAG: alpha/beta fold hydrolase [Halarcobacter ebronensis]|uniref:alpha/beta fold hydrolase n=1 Tax=Halarcobacter ebronensis TaxID=1462615 RepID=UPI003C7386DF